MPPAPAEPPSSPLPDGLLGSADAHCDAKCQLGDLTAGLRHRLRVGGCVADTCTTDLGDAEAS